MKFADIQMRDPFIVPVAEEQRYFLYGTTDTNCWDGPGTGFDVYSSTDLEHWDGPFPAFRPPQGFWAIKQFWAPEVHRFQGRYFMFASFKRDGVCRGTQILVAESPLGPFRLHSDGPVTPRDWECLDGTLYVAPDGTPWIVFCHEWVQVQDGEMCALRLSPELDRAIGEPQLLFTASSAPWVESYERDGKTFVTDGPFLHATAGGNLLMLWSSYGVDGYAIGIARSTTGTILGPWEQETTPLYGKDGGHGMVFRAFTSELFLTIHHPNNTPHERPILLPLREEDGCLISSK